MQTIPEKIDSKFRFVLLAAERAEQMMHGARPRVEMPGRKQSRVAMREIMEERVDWDYGPPEAEEEAEAEEVAAEAGEEE